MHEMKKRSIIRFSTDTRDGETYAEMNFALNDNFPMWKDVQQAVEK